MTAVEVFEAATDALAVEVDEAEALGSTREGLQAAVTAFARLRRNEREFLSALTPAEVSPFFDDPLPERVEAVVERHEALSHRLLVAMQVVQTDG